MEVDGDVLGRTGGEGSGQSERGLELRDLGRAGGDSRSRKRSYRMGVGHSESNPDTNMRASLWRLTRVEEPQVLGSETSLGAAETETTATAKREATVAKRMVEMRMGR